MRGRAFSSISLPRILVSDCSLYELGIHVAEDVECVKGLHSQQLSRFEVAMQLRMLNVSSSEDNILSTLDLIPIDTLEFLLIIAPLKDSYDLARVAFKAAATYRVSLKVCVIWPQGANSIHMNASGSGNELEPWKDYVDAEEVRRSESKSWWEMCQMTSKGVILVRPDDHIAWEYRN